VANDAEDDLDALSERLRRVEEELDGVFETIGRLVRSGETAAGELQRVARQVANLDRVEDRLVGALGEERDRISRIIDDHFARLERVLTAEGPLDERPTPGAVSSAPERIAHADWVPTPRERPATSTD
jgi:ABC-type transporter Mla subunit MlaD